MNRPLLFGRIWAHHTHVKRKRFIFSIYILNRSSSISALGAGRFCPRQFSGEWVWLSPDVVRRMLRQINHKRMERAVDLRILCSAYLAPLGKSRGPAGFRILPAVKATFP